MRRKELFPGTVQEFIKMNGGGAGIEPWTHKGTAPDVRRARRNYAAGAVRNRLRNRIVNPNGILGRQKGRWPK